MTLPTLSKTWQFAINQVAQEQGGSNPGMAQVMLLIKNALKGFASNAWTVVGSSNAGGTTGSPTGSAGMDAVDRWNTQADINTGGSNSRHAWIVLGQSGVATGFQVCFDFNNTGTINSITLSVSPSAGFTGGSATAAPTATDSIALLTTAGWCSGVDVRHIVHVWQSTDGQCTRIAVMRGGYMATYMQFDKPQNPVAGWTSPSVSAAWATASANVDAITHTLLASGTTQMYGKASAVMNLRFSGEGDVNGLLAQQTTQPVGNSPNELDTTFPFYPIGVYSITASGRGRHASVFDLWWKTACIPNGMTFPISDTNKQFVALGCLLLPWTNAADKPLIL